VKTLPNPPTSIAAHPGNGSVSVTWTPPTKDGNSPITSYTATATPGGQSCTYTVSAPETDTCTVTGLTNGTSYTFTVTATNAVGPSASSDVSNPATPSAPTAPKITSSPSTSFTLGSAGDFHLIATGSPVAALSESGALPSGVTFQDNGDGTASLSGTPAAATQGTYPLVITAANGQVPNATQSFTLTVLPTALTITTTSPLPPGTKGVSYSLTLTTTGGTAPYKWKRISGKLPKGLKLKANTGTISGKPKKTGNYSFTVLVIDSTTPTPETATQSLSITIS